MVYWQFRPSVMLSFTEGTLHINFCQSQGLHGCSYAAECDSPLTRDQMLMRIMICRIIHTNCSYLMFV